jgi:hypothetical protein
VHFAGIAAGADPRTFKQAMACPDAHRWQEAAVDEVNTLVANGTWEIVNLPPGKKAIGSGWVFKVKRNADGSVERYKGRVVAKGYSQRPGIDYTDLFFLAQLIDGLEAQRSDKPTSALEVESLSQAIAGVFSRAWFTLASGSVRIPPCDNSNCVMSALLYSTAICIMYVDSD